MGRLQELREAREAKVKDIQALHESGKDGWTSEHQEKFDALDKEIANFNQQISNAEKLIKIGDRNERDAIILANQNGKSVDQNTAKIAAQRGAMNAYFKFGASGMTEEQRDMLRPTDMADIGARGRDAWNIAEGSGATGGVMVPTTVMPTALEALKAFGGMREAATQIATSQGNPLSWATYDDTGAEGEVVAENATASDDDINFGSVTIGATKFSSKTIPVSIEILQDANVNVEQLVTNAILKRLARGQNRKFTTGTGANEPKGVITACALGETAATGNTTSVPYVSLLNLYHSVDPAYRSDPSCRWMFNDNTLKKLKTLVDGAGRPLWLPALSGAFDGAEGPATLLGKPYIINQHMADMAADAKSIAFGAFGKYLIRDVMAMQVFRFTDSVYVKKGQIGFLAWARADGNMIDATNTSIKYFKNSAT
ncbi:phage major capsid protein [Methylocystis iwaonis]|uniref:Phage capsid protein n=1 Tax=Methylocystis iwaonis TaxID=2885079 RepID=A0ABM8E7L4_9HYPH|nr:phage major capsid protein [Methylocystis iwaonis]BDV33932.1 phage capsid protein [Methylocystis iwaonis]